MAPKKIELKDITRDLAFVPGYTGYLPGYHLVYGTSAGEHSSNHLTRKWDAGGKNKDQTLMPSMYYTDNDRQNNLRKNECETSLLKHHSHMQGGVPKMTDHVDPKFSGYFPKQHYRFGQRHSVATRGGALEFIGNRHNKCKQDSRPFSCRPPEMPASLELQPPEPVLNPTRAPDYGAYLNKVTFRKDITDYLVQEVDKALTKPYRLPPGHMLKRFTHGYTAWLPFTTEFVGYTRGDLSKVCLQEMDKCLLDVDRFRATPAHTEPMQRAEIMDIQRIIYGIPGYTGYKEGSRHRYGYTHAKEMREVMRKRHPSLLEREMALLSSPLQPREIVVS